MHAAFRFSVKMPQAISHELRLVGTAGKLDLFLAEVRGLGDKLGCLLLQLPPSLAFERRQAGAFIRLLRKRFDGPVALEPRHSSWLTPAVDELLGAARIARVAADPARAVTDADPGGWPGLAYYRLHGSPVLYRSTYESRELTGLAKRLRAHRAAGAEAWCIFDNTMLGGATANALDLAARLRRSAAL